ncbi:MAG: DUF2207 domain-containing protein [Ruminococcaceae bacterium]|nr:DUF2207 domain-containing protein [Oscillospiraceae bacterium]
MDFIEYKRFAAFFKENYNKITKIMIIAGIICTVLGGIPALLGFFYVNGFYDLRFYFLIVAIAGIVLWGFGSGRVVKDFEFDDIFYRVSRDVKEKCESKFGYADDLKNAVMFEGFVINDEDVKSVRKFGSVCVGPMARVCFVYSRKEKFYAFTRTFSLTEEFCEDKEYDVHYSAIESAEYITKELTSDITTNKILIKDKDRTLLEAYVKVSDYDSESFPETVIHRRNHIMSRM